MLGGHEFLGNYPYTRKWFSSGLPRYLDSAENIVKVRPIELPKCDKGICEEEHNPAAFVQRGKRRCTMHGKGFGPMVKRGVRAIQKTDL
jgi:hypothetical protein